MGHRTTVLTVLPVHLEEGGESEGEPVQIDRICITEVILDTSRIVEELTSSRLCCTAPTTLLLILSTQSETPRSQPEGEESGVRDPSLNEHLGQVDAVESGGHVEHRCLWIVCLALDRRLDAPDQALVPALHEHGSHVCEALHTGHCGHHVGQVTREDHRDLEQVTRHTDRPDARLSHRLVDATKGEREHRGADRTHVGDRVRCREVDVWEVLLNPRRVRPHCVHDLLHRGRAAEVRQLLQRLLHVATGHSLHRKTICWVLPRSAELGIVRCPPLQPTSVVERGLLVHQILVDHPLEILARAHLLIELLQLGDLLRGVTGTTEGSGALRLAFHTGLCLPDRTGGLAHENVGRLVKHHTVDVFRHSSHPQ